MKKLLTAASVLASALALQAIDVKYSAVTFSTQGPDKYADGTTVLDGEVYAIVWSADGFDGFNADGSLVDANDKLVAALPFAEGGRCPDTVLNVAEGLYEGGSFGLYLLDTRKFGDDGQAKVAGVKDGKLSFVNRAEKADVEVKVAKAGSDPASAAAEAFAGAGAQASVLPADIPQPVIKDMQLVDGNAILTVDKTVDAANYQVVGGATPTAAEVLGEAKLGGGQRKFVFPTQGRDTSFIWIIRK